MERHPQNDCDACRATGHPRTNPVDGSLNYHYWHSDEELAAGLTHVMRTGPIVGSFEVGGVEYDCTPEVVAVHPDHAVELLYKIHKAHEQRGTFEDAPLPGDGSLEAFVKDREDRHAAALAAAAAEQADG